MAVSSVGTSWGQQVTLKDNYQPVQANVISYPALPWMQGILEKSSPIIYTGSSLLPHIQGLHNYQLDYEFPGVVLLHDIIYGSMMINNCRLDLSDIFSHLFDHCDPRGFGGSLEIVIQMQDYPCVLGGVHETLKYYNHCEGDGTTVDLRSSFQLDNLRIEIVQNEYIADPWAGTYLKPRIHTITSYDSNFCWSNNQSR